jgi:hypothetical protein
MLINKKNCKTYALEISKAQRNMRFTRVSKDFLDNLELHIGNYIKNKVIEHPSVGVTLK